MSHIPDTFPLVAIDKIVLGFRGIGEMVIHAELEFAHRLDVERLQIAFDLVLDAEPILGCRSESGCGLFGRAKWVRLRAAERANFRVVGSEGEYEAFVLQPPGAEIGPQIRGCLLPGTDEGKPDRLAVTITHDAGDAGGLKEAVAQIGEVYTRLAREPAYLPTPNLAGSRSTWQALRRVPWRHFPRIYLNYLKAQWTLLTVGTGPRMPWNTEREGRPIFVVRHIPADRIARLSAYGRTLGATLNDLIVAAGMRALTTIARNEPNAPFQLLTTADLRKHYLPNGKAEAICNLSGLEYIVLDGSPTTFDATVAAVAAKTRARKASWLGLSDFLGATPALYFVPGRWVKAIFGAMMEFVDRRDVSMVGLTNMGPITTEGTTFDRPATRAHLRVPPLYPPRLAIGLTGYDGSLTLSAATFAPGGSAADLERLFDLMSGDLPQ